MTVLGIDTKTGKEVKIYKEDINLGGYIVGVRRMGKSTILENLCVQAIEQDRAVVVIDPHGDSLYNILNRIPDRRMEDVILLDPLDYQHPFGLNIYHCTDKHNPVAVDYTVNRVMSLFQKLFPSDEAQPLVEDVIRNTAYTIIANGMTMTEVDPLLTDATFRRRLVANETNPAIRSFWKSYEGLKADEKEKWGGVIGRRVRGFTTSGIIRYIVGQAENTLPITEIMGTRKILLVRVYSDMKPLTSLIGSILVGQMLQSALSRKGARPEVHLFCDEYSMFATDDFAEIISECGKYNLIPFIAHQSRGQISEENQDSAIQLGNLFCFKMIGKDADKLAVQYDLTPPEEKKVIPSESARELERIYVRRLLEAKAMTVRTVEEEKAVTNEQGNTLGMGLFKPFKVDVDIYPEHQFSIISDIITFNPQKLRYEVLPLLDSILFSSMTVTGYKPWEDIMEFMQLTRKWYGFEYVLKNDGTIDGFPERDSTEHMTAGWIKEVGAWAKSAPADYLVIQRMRFVSLLVTLSAATDELRKRPIYVTPSTGGKPQQTYADRAGQVANDIVQLDKYHARIHTPKGEFVIKTIPPPSDKSALKRKTDKAMAQTREGYTTPREEVEAAIQARLEGIEPPTTKRR